MVPTVVTVTAAAAATWCDCRIDRRPRTTNADASGIPPRRSACPGASQPWVRPERDGEDIRLGLLNGRSFVSKPVGELPIMSERYPMLVSSMPTNDCGEGSRCLRYGTAHPWCVHEMRQGYSPKPSGPTTSAAPALRRPWSHCPLSLAATCL